MFRRAKSGDEVFIKNGFMIYRVLQKKPITHIVVHVWEKAPLHVFCVHMCILGMHGCMCFCVKIYVCVHVFLQTSLCILCVIEYMCGGHYIDGSRQISRQKFGKICQFAQYEPIWNVNLKSLAVWRLSMPLLEVCSHGGRIAWIEFSDS